MTQEEFLPAVLAALPAAQAPARFDGKYEDLISTARRLAERHAVGDVDGLAAGLAVVERCFAEGTHPAALEAAALLQLVLEFAHDMSGGDDAVAAHMPPLARSVCQQIWIHQGELSEWMTSNLPLAGDDFDDPAGFDDPDD